MNYKRLNKDKTAVAGVIEALLLIGLVAIVLSFIQIYYVPEIMEEKEADHMDQVLNQFSNLKSVIDIQSTMGIINEDSPTGPKDSAYTSISSPITMGSKELPYFVSARSYGQVTLIDRYKADDYRINIQPAPDFFGSGVPLTSIKYDAMNSYFVRQTYALEGGGIVLKQYGGEVMKVFPAMNIKNYTNEIEINWDIPLFKGVSGKNITAGYKECYVYTNFTKYYEDQISLTPEDDAFIHIYTDYPVAWSESLIDEDGLLWEYNEENYINVTVNYAETPNRVEITPAIKDIYLRLTITEIRVQIGAGRVIKTG